MAAPDLTTLQDRLGCRFRDEKLLALALTHPSSSRPGCDQPQHNQRLEFLGDAILGLVLAWELCLQFPGLQEGQLTQCRAKLVNRHALALRGRALDLGPLLILSKGEEKSGGRNRPSALADAYEAVLGAILLDQGFETVRSFIQRDFSEELKNLETSPGLENPKGSLQERLQSTSNATPEYQLISAEGAKHDQSFECAVFHEGRELARGRGKTKRLAETAAALEALKLFPEENSPLLGHRPPG